jgi:hypothetical protein
MNSSEIIFYNDLLIFYGRIALSTLIIPIIMGLWQGRVMNRPLRFFLFYLASGLTIALLEQLFIWSTTKYYPTLKPYLDYWKIEDTNFYQILYYLKNFALLGWFYSLLLPNSVSIWVKRVSIFLLFAALINYLFIEGYLVFGVFNPIADAVFCFVLPLIYLGFLYQKDSIVPLSKNPYFWISLGMVVPNLLNLIFQFIGNQLLETDFILFAKLTIGKNGITVIGHILLAIGFYYARYVKFMSPSDADTTPSV